MAKLAYKSPPRRPVEVECVTHPKRVWVTPFLILFVLLIAYSVIRTISKAGNLLYLTTCAYEESLAPLDYYSTFSEVYVLGILAQPTFMSYNLVEI